MVLLTKDLKLISHKFAHDLWLLNSTPVYNALHLLYACYNIHCQFFIYFYVLLWKRVHIDI